MSDEELGFYHRCLNFAWINDGIPADSAARARALRRNRRQADARWTTLVASRFKPHEQRAGYLVNDKQEMERLLAQQKSLKASESAKARSERITENKDVCSPRASDSASVSKGFEFIKETSLQVLDDFSRFTEACNAAELSGSSSDLTAAGFEWRRLNFQQKLDAVQGIRDRVAAGEFSDPGFRPLPQNYLKNRIWQREVRVRRQEPKSVNDRAIEIVQRNLEQDRRRK